MKQLCFAHNANKVATTHISLHICGMISYYLCFLCMFFVVVVVMNVVVNVDCWGF